MQRKWAVWPDTDQGVVSREAMVNALLEGEVLLARAGGVLSVVVQREPTGVPGEMVTTGAMIEWKDRTDAKPQPESTVRVVAPKPGPDAEDEAFADAEALQRAYSDAEAVHHDLAEAQKRADVALPDDSPDGLDPSTLEEEDVSSIPSRMR